MNAFVEATPISGPARVYSTASATRVVMEPTTFVSVRIGGLLEEGVGAMSGEDGRFTLDLAEGATVDLDITPHWSSVRDGVVQPVDAASAELEVAHVFGARPGGAVAPV